MKIAQWCILKSNNLLYTIKTKTQCQSKIRYTMTADRQTCFVVKNLLIRTYGLVLSNSISVQSKKVHHRSYNKILETISKENLHLQKVQSKWKKTHNTGKLQHRGCHGYTCTPPPPSEGAKAWHVEAGKSQNVFSGGNIQKTGLYKVPKVQRRLRNHRTEPQVDITN